MSQHEQNEILDDDEDPVLGLMRDNQIPVTRENYLGAAYWGQMPEEWTAEHEAQLPAHLQEWDASKWPALNAAAQSAEPSEIRMRHSDIVAAYPQLTDDYLDKMENCT